MENGNATSIVTGRPRVRVIFEFAARNPKLTFYRAVQATDGGYRMEKRGEFAKNYKPFMWCGSEAGLYQHKQAVEFCLRLSPLPFITPPTALAR